MKDFRVKIWISGRRTEVNIKAINGVGAMNIAKKMYPNSRVITAQQIK